MEWTDEIEDLAAVAIMKRIVTGEYRLTLLLFL
jgi:hypothetical protein